MMSEGAVGGLPGVGETTFQPAVSGNLDAFQALIRSIDPQLAQNPNLTRHNDMSSLAKEHINLLSAVGRKGVILPNESDPTDKQRFYKELGRPENPGAYNFGDFKPPEGMPWDDQVGARMVAKMWERGLTQDQVPGVVGDFVEIQKEAWEQREQLAVRTNQQTIGTLQKELGQAYTERMNLTHRAVTTLFEGTAPEEILNLRLENGVALGDYMPFVRAMMKASDGIKEHDLIDDPTKTMPGAKTPAEAAKELEVLMGDADFRESYFSPQHINHAVALAKVEELYAYKGNLGSATQVGIGGTRSIGVTPNPNASL